MSLACQSSRRVNGNDGRIRQGGIFSLVAHPFKKQSGRRCRRLIGIRTLSDHAGKGRNGDVPTPDFHESRHQLSDHLPQEMGSLDPDQNQFLGALHCHRFHHDDRGLVLSPLIREGGEIMASRNLSAGGFHRFHVQAILDPPYEWLSESCSTSGDLVNVRSKNGVMPRVKSIVGSLDGQNVNVRWKQVVDLFPHRIERYRLSQSQMSDLSRSVNSGVCSSSASEVCLAEQLLNGELQLALHRFRGIPLALPAGVPCSFVFDGQSVSRHRCEEYRKKSLSESTY